MEKRYGLPTAICMVVGIVIGSGVFFKAEKVLQATKGNMPLGILAWGIVGAIMIICSYVFATMATRYEKVSGLVDYAEATVGRRYAYYVGWFMAVLYTPCLVSALAWISARYFCVLLGWDITGGACMTIAGAMLCLDHVLNALAPRLAGRFQVSTTVIKMIPLALMAVCGAAVGMMNGRMAENFATMSTGAISTGEGLMASTVAVAFAYEGWILATSINAELRDAKRTLPEPWWWARFIVVLTYILYYIGLTGAVTTEELMASGEAAAKMAFQRVFGETAGTVVFVLIVISCLGTLNGLTLSCCRGMYALEIAEFPLILLERKASSRVFLEQYFLQSGITLTPEIELSSRSLLVSLARIGLGVAGVTLEFVQKALDSGDIRLLKTDFTIPARSVDMCTLRDVTPTPRPPPLWRWSGRTPGDGHGTAVLILELVGTLALPPPAPSPA